jgi:hypothetical protein
MNGVTTESIRSAPGTDFRVRIFGLNLDRVILPGRARP